MTRVAAAALVSGLLHAVLLCVALWHVAAPEPSDEPTPAVEVDAVMASPPATPAGSASAGESAPPHHAARERSPRRAPIAPALLPASSRERAEITPAPPTEAPAAAAPATSAKRGIDSTMGPSGAIAGGAGSSGTSIGPGGGAPGVSTGVGRAVPSSLVEVIRSRVEAHRRYPSLARRQGLEGTVELVFSITPDGGVSGITVVRSAGALLDQAAEEAVRLSVPFPRCNLPVRLPIHFRLTDGRGIR
jgi:protein TonB